MSSQFNSFRSKRYLRSRFLDGRFLLSQEATDLELEILEYARRLVSTLLGDVAVENAWKVDLVPSGLISNDQKKLLVRPGLAYYDGLIYEMSSGEDHKVSADADQPKTALDDGGKVLDFTSKGVGYYKIIAKAQEEKVTAGQDNFIQGAAVPEATEEKRRLIYTLDMVSCDANGNIAGKNALSFTRTDDLGPSQQQDFFNNNDLFSVPRTPNSIVSTSDTLGSDAAVTLDNTTGVGTLFPTGTLMSDVFAGGLFIDPNGSRYIINAVQVTTGPDRVTFTLDKDIAVPAGSGLQPDPDLSSPGFNYTLIPKDVVYANPATGVPDGDRNYHVAIAFWNGSDFNSTTGILGTGYGFESSGGTVKYNIKDLRKVATDNLLELISSRLSWLINCDGSVHWNLSTETLTWSDTITIKDPTNSSGLEFTIAANDTNTLFGSNFADQEVLYFVIPDGASGVTSVSLQKDAIDSGDLLAYPPEKIFVLGIRESSDVVFANTRIKDGDYAKLYYNANDEIPKVNYLDPISTTLPVGVSYTADGTPVVNGDIVLFTNLSSNNNRAYEVSGVGVSLVWTALNHFKNNIDPLLGQRVRVLSGASFGGQTAVFNGTNFLVNDTVRFFNGVSANFWELSSIKSLSLSNNTTANVFSVTVSGSENFVVSYSIVRGSAKETGQLLITSDGTNARVADYNVTIGLSGTTFSAAVSLGNLVLSYTTDNSGSSGSLKYFVQRWSDSAGGPSGIPNYNTSPGSPIPAAGNVGEVQFHGVSGNLDADSDFKWDSSNKAIDLNGALLGSLSSSITLLDNQASPTTAFSYSVASSNHNIIEYGIVRNGEYRTGRLVIGNGLLNIAYNDDYVETALLGIVLSASISGGNVNIQYTTTNTGFNGSLTYIFRRW